MNESKETEYNLPAGFNFVKCLGKGFDGFVLLCQYHGSDEKVKALCDSQGFIAGKFAHPGKKLDLNEADISKEIAKSCAKNPSFNTKLNPIFAYNNEQGETLCLLSRAISYKVENGIPISSDLESFFKERYLDPATNPDKLSSVLKSDLSVVLSQLATAMHSAQAALHTSSMIHSDTSTRNFLLQIAQQDPSGNIINFSPVLIDYSRSKSIAEHQSVAMNPQAAPFRYLNIAVYETRNQNVASDLFAMRCAIIEMAGFASGATDVNDIFALSKPNEFEHFVKMRYNEYADDNKTLTKYLDNVEQFAKKCPDEHKKAELELFISSYREYLTQMPPSLLSNKEAKDYDRSRLLTANDKFVQECYKKKFLPIFKTSTDSEQLKLLACRLCAIEVGEKTKNSIFYKVIMSVAETPNIKSISQRAADKVATPLSPPAVVASPVESNTRSFKS